MEIKANQRSMSGKTFYFYVSVPAGVVTLKEGTFCGTSDKEVADIEEIGWLYCFGKKHFTITKNGKNKLADFKEIIEKYSQF